MKMKNFFTADEQKVIFFLILFGFLGIGLRITKLKAQEKIVDQTELQKVVSEVIEMKYDIRTATKEEFQNLPGIGPSRAEDIIAYRDANGFSKSSDLLNIKGIGKRTYAKIMKNIVIFGEDNIASEANPVSSKNSKKSKKNTKLININTASAEELVLLKGIGLEKAKKIIEYRTTIGKFDTIEQLAEVKGIGVNTVNKNKERIIIENE